MALVRELVAARAWREADRVADHVAGERVDDRIEGAEVHRDVEDRARRVRAAAEEDVLREAGPGLVDRDLELTRDVRAHVERRRGAGPEVDERARAGGVHAERLNARAGVRDRRAAVAVADAAEGRRSGRQSRRGGGQCVARTPLVDAEIPPAGETTGRARRGTQARDRR